MNVHVVNADVLRRIRVEPIWRKILVQITLRQWQVLHDLVMVLPLLQSATGQVFHAFGDRGYFDARARAEQAASETARGIDVAALRARVRDELCARVDGDLIPGLRVVAAPVFDLQGRLSIVVTSIATPAIGRHGDAAAEAALLASCRRLTESLGGRWPAGA